MDFVAVLNNSRKTVIWYNINLGIIHRRKPVIYFWRLAAIKCEAIMIHFRDSSYLSFLADSGAFVLKVSLFVFLNGELAQYGQSVRLLNGRSQVQILYSPILFCQMTGNIKQKVVNYNNSD